MDEALNLFTVIYFSIAGVALITPLVLDIINRILKKSGRRMNNGRWISHIEHGVTTYVTDKYVECTECHHRQPRLFDMNFCPNCGADIRGSEND